MAEEHKWQEPEGHRLCANNCGFFGSPTTLDLCSKCYKDHCLKEERATTAKLAVEKSLTQSPSASSSSSSSSSELLVSFTPHRPISPENPATSVEISAPAAAVVSTQANRCAACRKRVGLTGFKCRCGPTYCGAHRYPEEHGCTFDFKALGKEAIAKANPVVVAEKLEKI